MKDKFYILHVSDKNYSALKKDMENFNFVNITDLFSSDELKLNFLKMKFPVSREGDPNEGLSKDSRFYFNRILKRPYQDKFRMVGKYAIEYAIGKRENIKKMFDVDLDYNSIGIFSDEIPTKVIKINSEYEDWMLTLKYVNLEGNLEKLKKEYGVEKYGYEDFSLVKKF